MATLDSGRGGPTPTKHRLSVEHLVMGLGGYAKWSDKHHLTVELNGKKESFYTTKDKSAHLQPDDEGVGLPIVGGHHPGYRKRIGRLMINVEIDAKNYDLDDDLRSRAKDRIGGLDEFMSTLDEGRVTFSWRGGTNEQTEVYAKVWGRGNEFEASDTDWMAKKALDQTRQKLESQIRRKHSEGLKDHDQHR